MNLKKGLSFVAFGFFFTLVNVNLRLNGTAVNITPDFVGWILLFLAFDKLGDYVAGKVYIKWLSLLLIVMSAAEWIYEVVKPELDTGAVKTFNTVLGGIYMFLLLGVLAEIARDYSSPRAGILGVLRFLNPALLLGCVLTGITGVSVGTTAVLGFAALAAAIVTMAVLFLLSREIGSKLDDQSERKEEQS